MRLLLAAAALCATAFATSASAQSWFGQGQYVSLAVGAAGQSDYSIAYPEGLAREDINLESAAAFQLGLGTRTGPVRLEAAFTYRNHDANSRFIRNDTNVVLSQDSGELSVKTLDLNLFYDLPTGGPVRPYVGAGLGFAGVTTDVGGMDDEGTVLNLQGMAGVSFDVSPRTAFFVEGRVQRAGNVDVDTQLIFSPTDTRTGRDEFDVSNTAAFAGVRFGF